MAKQRNWGSALAMLAFAGFIATSLWAKWNPAGAQEQPKSAVQAKPADAAHAKDAKGKAAPVTGTRGQGFQPDWGKCWVSRPQLTPAAFACSEPEYRQRAAGHLHRDGQIP